MKLINCAWHVLWEVTKGLWVFMKNEIYVSGFPGFKVSPPGNIRRKQTPILDKLYNRSLQETDYQGSSQSMSR